MPLYASSRAAELAREDIWVGRADDFLLPLPFEQIVGALEGERPVDLLPDDLERRARVEIEQLEQFSDDFLTSW
jgi:hypothetical protein